jgi:DNA polymerase-3 subunit alpha
MDGARDWLKEHQNEVLSELNKQLFMDTWNKYAQGSLSSWEMESLCFYYHEHELANVDTYKYGISNFFALPEEPEVDYYFKRNGQQIPIWKTHKIIGTVIAKNDNKASITLLTPSGVVTVKFTKEYYAQYKKQLSELQDDGSKKVTEKGWFKRGTMLLLTGFRRGDQFVTKTYKHTPTHQIYKISLFNDGRDMELVHERKDMEE